MPEAVKNIGDSVRARLLRISKEKGQNFDLVLTHYAIERLLYRLTQSRHADRFVVFSAFTSSGSSCRCFQDACAIVRAGAQHFGHALQNRVIEPIGTGVVDGFGNQVRQYL